MPEVTNISTYLFTALDDLDALRDRLKQSCRDWKLKGTILLSKEGINLFVAGPQAQVDQLLSLLRAVPGLEKLEPKISKSNEQPFRRMLVKIKKEIIAFGVEGIDPARDPAPRLSPHELKLWLDEGRPVTLLDTRNDYEVSLGTFRHAVPIGIQHFRDFPAATAKLPLKAQQGPIVTFCTGGIRCEKAAPYMLQQGFEQVFQLDGGILKYFEECGNAHFDGECFVFDNRVGLSGDLDETGHKVCYACQNVLTPDEVDDPRTVERVSCPHCYQSPEEQAARALAERRIKLRAATNPLPGQGPRDNFRPLQIDAFHEGLTILDLLCSVFPQVHPRDWQTCCDGGDLLDSEHRPVVASHQVRSGERYLVRQRLPTEPDVNAAIEILYEDASLIVLNKPAPLPMRPGGVYRDNTLQSILCDVYAPQKPRPVNHLGADTSGLTIFSRTSKHGNPLLTRFERGEAMTRYLVRVIGSPTSENLLYSETEQGEQPRHPSATQFEVCTRFSDGSYLLCATTRTNSSDRVQEDLRCCRWQIVSDLMSGTNGKISDVQEGASEEGVPRLFAWQITFKHPQQGKEVTFEAPRPSWANVST